jgi:hypothetical protein
LNPESLVSFYINVPFMRLRAANRVLFGLMICLGYSVAVSSDDQKCFAQKQPSAGDGKGTAKSIMKDIHETKVHRKNKGPFWRCRFIRGRLRLPIRFDM